MKKGDLLVEFDGSPIQRALDDATLALKRAREEKLLAMTRFENQIVRNQTLLADAELRVAIANLELESFEELSSAKLKSLETALQRNAEQVQSLREKGQWHENELKRRQSRSAEMERELDQLKQHDYPKQRLRTEGEVQASRRNVDRVKRDNE